MIKDWSKKSNLKTERVNYTADILVDSEFRTPGAITITNKHQSEFFLETITIEGFACGPVHFPCNSWVQSTNDHPKPIIFFSNQRFFPSEFGVDVDRQNAVEPKSSTLQGKCRSVERLRPKGFRSCTSLMAASPASSCRRWFRPEPPLLW